MKKPFNIVGLVVAILISIIFFALIMSLFSPQVTVSQDDAKKAMEAAKKVSEALED